MKYFLVLAVVVSLAGLCAAQDPSTHHRRTNDSRCSQVKFSSTSARPSYHGPGFGTVENSSPDEPFIVPAGCVQFFCGRQGETYRVLSCPNLKAKSSLLATDTKQSPSTENSAPTSR
jgi:hypothetical protein